MDVLETDTRLGGMNQSGLRDHNERLLLSTLQRYGAMPGSDLARLTRLSPQTVSVILRKLEVDGLLSRGEPVRGKVGKPSIPMQLAPDGVFSFGMKVGRRSADLLLLDFQGVVRSQASIRYEYPQPREIFDFLEAQMAAMLANMSVEARQRVCGIGIAVPFDIWRWHGATVASAEGFAIWKDIKFETEVARFTALPVSMVNDATAACRAEHLYGQGSGFQDYAHFFIGAFIGGGVVLNGAVYEGRRGNAGALGSMRSTGPLGESRQLVDVASLHLLEARLVEAGIDTVVLWENAQDWSAWSRYVDPWIGETSQELAKAALSVCSVIDFEGIVIDGAFPAHVRADLVERTQRYITNQDKRGLIPPQIIAGSIGYNARAIGAASGPIISQLLLR